MAELALSPAVDAFRAENAGRRALRAFVWVFFAGAIVFAVVAWRLGDTFFLRLATESLIYAGLGLSVDILLGYTGLLSLGQALFFGLGAYVSALVLKHVAPSFWMAIAISLIVGTLGGLLCGVIAIRVRGVYFALITFGMAQIVAKIVYNTRELGASDGIIGIPIIAIDFPGVTVAADDPLGFFLVVLAATLLIYAGCAYLMDSPFGRVLVAIRANDRRVPFLGYRSNLYKLLAYVLAADVAVLSGAFYPMLRGFVSPELMFFDSSGNAVISVVVGGVGTLVGALYGGVIITTLKSVIGSYTEHHLIVIGLLFMISVIFFPKGLIGYAKARFEQLSGPRSGGER